MADNVWDRLCAVGLTTKSAVTYEDSVAIETALARGRELEARYGATVVAFFYDKPGGIVTVDFRPNPSEVSTPAAAFACDVERFIATCGFQNTLRLVLPPDDPSPDLTSTRPGDTNAEAAP